MLKLSAPFKLLSAALAITITGCGVSVEDLPKKQPGASVVPSADASNGAGLMDSDDLLRGHGDVSFSIAPDGNQILFSGSGRGGRDLYLLNRATSSVVRLTDTEASERDPSISPDGKRITYAAGADPAASLHLYIRPIAPADGSVQPRQLTEGDNVYDVAPSFSPDGTQVVFARAHRKRAYSMGGQTWDHWDVYVVNSDGTQLKRITNENYFLQFAPRFSPDGKKIIFSAGRASAAGSQTNVLVAESHPSRKKPAPLTQDGRSYWPSFSPDGKHLAFVADPGGTYSYEVHTVSVDGGDPRAITGNRSYNIKPEYTPDGQHVLFLSDPQREGRYELWQVPLAGGDASRIADGTLFDDPLRWGRR